MKPAEVLDLGNRLHLARERDDEEAGTEAAFKLFIGIAFNLAVLANPPVMATSHISVLTKT